MKTIVYAFDVDGTLRCNCSEKCTDYSIDMWRLVKIFSTKFKNVQVIVWSGGGREYAWDFVKRCKLDRYVKESQCWSKLEYIRQHGKPDNAIDDQHEFDLGEKNSIVRLK